VRLVPARGTFHEYSHASAEAREIGVRLLETSKSYEGFEAAGRDDLAIAGLVARARRLLCSAYRLADAGEGLEAAVLLRSMTEYCFSLLWLASDPEVNIPRWLHDGLVRILSQDKELRSIERRHRRDAGLPEPVPADEPLGLLRPEMRERMIAARDALRAELGAIDDLADRLEPPREDDVRAPEVRARDVPSFRRQAKLTGLGDVYALSYTFDSLAIAHPNSMAAEQLLKLSGDRSGGAVAEEPIHALPDPYAVGAALLLLLLETAGEQIPELAIDGLADVLETLRALKPFKSDG
jgi:Family of unknown function (DUF5677)